MSVLRVGADLVSLEKFARPRLLLVDDERGVRETLAAILRRYGFKVAVAATVEEAVAEIARQQFGLLLCDLNIEADGDGFDVIRATRHLCPDCIVIILTGYPSMGSAIQGMQLGVEDYIPKPANPEHLIAALAEKLAGKNQSRKSTIGG